MIVDAKGRVVNSFGIRTARLGVQRAIYASEWVVIRTLYGFAATYCVYGGAAGCVDPGTFVRVDEARTNFRDSNRGTRVLLFTDTYADVNGPSRFVQNMADCARSAGRDLTVFTSTRMAHRARTNVVNFAPLLAMPMPGYAVLDVVLPPWAAMIREARRVKPDVIHVSTPGPVGLGGVAAAWLLGVPLVGVYHTDFPSYVDRLFEDGVLTRMARASMHAFYGRFAALFVRSAEYAGHVHGLGITRCRVERLRPGIDLAAFGRRFRDIRAWDCEHDFERSTRGTGVRRKNVRVLYCGRVSVEKNLGLLARIWPRVVQGASEQGVGVELIVVGDGPMRGELERACRGLAATFMGFRFDEELARLYASSDLFVFPSVTDTLGQVVLEAQASGLACIVSDVGGPKETVRDGVTGVVVPHGDEQRWIDAVVRLAVDDELRAKMGNAAVEMMAGMSIEKSFEHFWRVHEAVANR